MAEAIARKPARRLVWLALPVAALVLAGASSPSIAQRVPRFFFPALAAAGGGLVLASLVSSLIRLRRPGARPRILALVLNVVATTFLVVLPLTRLVGVMAAPASGPPRVLAGFGDWLGGEGYPRISRHRGIDLAGTVGADVLAAAAGRVTVARDSRDLCGLIVAIAHDPHGYRTIYCHLSAIAVTAGQTVGRGQQIGALGTTGQRAWPGYEHVHLEQQRGSDPEDLEDPARRIVGCFDAAGSYPTDRLVLTYPIRC